MKLPPTTKRTIVRYNFALPYPHSFLSIPVPDSPGAMGVRVQPIQVERISLRNIRPLCEVLCQRIHVHLRRVQYTVFRPQSTTRTSFTGCTAPVPEPQCRSALPPG